MQIVHKYPLVLQDFQTIKLPQMSTVRKVGHDAAGQLCLWAEVNTDNAPEDLRIYICGTGHPVPDHAQFIDTVFDEQFVWHIWQEVR